MKTFSCSGVRRCDDVIAASWFDAGYDFRDGAQ